MKEDARKAVHLAVNQAFQKALLNDDVASLDAGISGGSVDLSSESHSSIHSHEQAIRRGSKLAEVAMNESENSRRQLFLDDNDGNTDARTGTTASKSILWPRRKKKKKGKVEKIKETEAWMCGVCAKCFSSFEAAERHEDYHVKEVLMDLGWGAENNDATSIFSHNSSPSERPRNPDRHQGASKQTNTKMQPRPDILRMASPHRPSNRASVQPYTPTIQRKKLPTTRRYSDDSYSSHHEEDPGDEFKLATSLAVPHVMTPIFENSSNHRISGSIDENSSTPLLLADEALVDVCRKAESLGLLTADEKDAEFEIECLAKDKAYYDLLSTRCAQRKQDGTYRFRREGSSAISKVQNKFVDAYQLMKEGKTKRGSTTLDYYTRKLKGNAEEGQMIDHTRNTLYVNVMVKNSIKVVRHELERLAKRRWEDSLRNGKEETDIQRKRFQKFRAAAQGNLVKLAGYALAADFTPRRVSSIVTQMCNFLMY